MTDWELEDRLHLIVSRQLEVERVNRPLDTLLSRKALAKRIWAELGQQDEILPKRMASDLVKSVVNRITGLGPLQPLLDDPAIDEIMVNDPTHVFVEKRGRIQPVGVVFRDGAHLRHIIDRIVGPVGRRVDEASPMVDARLPDGSRVNAILPPLALGGPVLTIRKFSRVPFTLARLVELGSVPEEISEFLIRCVRKRASLLVTGGTGTGKTSMLNALSLHIPTSERLITIEDSAELQLDHPHRVALESRPPNLEGEGEITIRTLVRNALRMRPDRIIVGEVRGGEAFDMLQAMNTGHRGSMSTLHANSARDALVRLESMVMMAGFDLPLEPIRRMIASAVEVIIHLDRNASGKRVVEAVMELKRRGSAGIEMKELFRSKSASAEVIS